MSRRDADTANTAQVPAFAVVNAMISYEFSEHLKLQVNLNNLTDKLYFTSLYYSAVDENHVVPGPGRTAIVMLSGRCR